MRYIIYTDGGSRGNPGEGAWGYVQVTKGIELLAHAEYSSETTNNEMELTAVLRALQYCSEFIVTPEIGKDCTISIHSDSTYCVNGVSTWMYNWNNQGTLDDRPNGGLWKEVFLIIQSLKTLGVKIEMIKVKGHSGDKWNERVDAIVNESMDKKGEVHYESTEVTKVQIPELNVKNCYRSIKVIGWNDLPSDCINIIFEDNSEGVKTEVRIKKSMLKDILRSL